MTHEFREYDYAALKHPYLGIYPHVRLLSPDEDGERSWHAFVLDCGKEILVNESEMTYLPPKHLTSEELRPFFRFERTAEELDRISVPPGNFLFDDYGYTLDDAEAAVRNILSKHYERKTICSQIELLFGNELDSSPEEEAEFDEEHPFLEEAPPENDFAMAELVYELLQDTYDSDREDNEAADLTLVLRDIEAFRAGEPIRPERWSRGQKIRCIERTKKSNLRAFSDEERSFLRSLITELALEEEPTALERIGYCCYGGDELFVCDWELSRDSFLLLMENSDVGDEQKCYYANTLGYIFYYGRCTNGEPEYERAYRYFSVGAAGGVYESFYKLSDMFVHGYFVQKNTHAAKELVRLVYEDNLKLIKRGHFECKFADAALRMGNLCRDGVIRDESALYYYTLADFAIRKRLPFHHYGDRNVFGGIQKELAKLREKKPLVEAAKISYYGLPYAARELLREHVCRVTLAPKEDGIGITIERRRANGKTPSRVFECYPDCGYCELVSGISFSFKGEKLPVLTEEVRFFADEATESHEDDGSLNVAFSLCGEEMYSLCARETFRLFEEEKKEQKKYRFASVVFTPGGKPYDYLCELENVNAGDRVIVFANGEEKTVEVVRVFEMDIADMPLDVKLYKKILRKAEE